MTKIQDDKKFHKKSGWHDDGSGWRPRARSNVQPWNPGKPPRLSSISSCGGRKRRCRPFLSSSRHIYTLLVVFPPPPNFFISGVSNGEAVVKGRAGDCFYEEEKEVILNGVENIKFTTAVMMTPNHRSTLLPDSVGWWCRRNLQISNVFNVYKQCILSS